MSSRIFSIIMLIGTIAALIAFAIVIFYTSPQQADLMTFLLFYVTLFLVLLGTIFLTGNFIREKFFRKQLIYQRLSTSLRQGIFFSILIIGWGLLKSRDIASWWIIILFILALTMMEFFFISTRKNKIL